VTEGSFLLSASKNLLKISLRWDGIGCRNNVETMYKQIAIPLAQKEYQSESPTTAPCHTQARGLVDKPQGPEPKSMGINLYLD